MMGLGGFLQRRHTYKDDLQDIRQDLRRKRRVLVHARKSAALDQPNRRRYFLAANHNHLRPPCVGSIVRLSAIWK